MSDYHFYQPKEGHNLKHDPFNGIIAPRPIGWISTLGQDGNANLAPYSFFNAFNYSPPLIGFSSIGYKDTVRNAEQTGEFCWNLVSQSLAQAMNLTSQAAPIDVDEFELAQLAKGNSRMIKPPYVLHSPVVMECKTSQIIQLRAADGSHCDTWLVMGEVVGVHIANQTLRDGVYQTTLAQPVLRGGGAGDYFTLSEQQKFVMKRP
ncbi:flavin reductase family protein [Aliiglaciecola sp. LCG003]|uniref:flavin reductase family protein n=1 Tax=Aliiglaciecola sp. LCG003 TaxID=3053655 RepID=UPI00257291A0|nr:flavin reductase family protein [Aliiglaciecola sp. LCG003]WJG10724.1 flavin reductase family protein [Aliiglaciecola sp. LCG003]